MKRPSGSSLHLLHSCVASHVYPQVATDGEAAQRGRAAHVELEKLVRAAAEIPGLGSSKNYAPEVSFAYCTETDTARVLGASLGRDYKGLKESEIPMTADIIGETRDAVIVGDWKVKNGWEGPARSHPQLRALALAAARCAGKDRAHVFWVKFDPSALPEFVVTWQDSAELDSFDLDVIADELRESVGAWRRSVTAFKNGQEPNLREGGWCRWCPAAKSCRAKTGLVRAAISQPISFVDAVRDLAPEQIGEAYQRANAAMSQLHALKAEIEALARENPVPLPDGRVLMLVEGKAVERVVDGRKAAEVLLGVLGPKGVMAACEMKTSKAAIGYAVSLVRNEAGPDSGVVKLWKSSKDCERAILETLRSEGAIQKVPGEAKVKPVAGLPAKKDEAA